MKENTPRARGERDSASGARPLHPPDVDSFEPSDKSARLTLRLLGPFQAQRTGQTLLTFKSAKVRALLAYLAVEAELPHDRGMLASLLWTNWPDSEARANLRYALYNLRTVLDERPPGHESGKHEPYLIADRSTIQFNPASDYWLDTQEVDGLSLERLRCPPETPECRRILELYRGEFLQGFYLDDCPAFEEWLTLRRERYSQLTLNTLRCLASYDAASRHFGRAERSLRKLLELDPWDEAAHQTLMRVLYLSGRRSAAIVQYNRCIDLLNELGVEPLEQTTRLYDRIRRGKMNGEFETVLD